MNTAPRFKDLALCLVLWGLVAAWPGASVAHALSSGDRAPGFSLKDLQGKHFDASGLKGKALSIVYFFSPSSRASARGIEMLLGIRRAHPGWDVEIVAVSEGSVEETAAWARKRAEKAEVVIDDGRVASLYGVGQILPVAYLLGPDMVILNKVKGGGAGGHKLLVRLAERELSRKQIKVAETLAQEAARAAPGDAEAKAVLGYAALKSGKIDEAEDVFAELSSMPETRAIGKEGLAHVRLRQGKDKEALALAEQAGGRAGADTIKGDILYAQGRESQAEAIYEQAASEPAFTFQRSRPLNRLGKLAAAREEYPEAVKYYDKALEVDPLAVEVLSNKGVLLGKEGKWDMAAKTYQAVLKMAPQDQIASGLLRQAQEMLALARDAQKAERIDRLIKELSERYKKGRFKSKAADEWTSRPMVLAFLPLTEGGLPLDRDGVTQVLALEIGRCLEATGRIRVVERALMDKLLAELNIGSSELADPGTALRLGKVLAAKLLAAGYLRNSRGMTTLSLRLIDSETSAVPAVVTAPVDVEQVAQAARKVAKDLMAEVVHDYPLRGYIVRTKDGRVILNLGRDQGLKTGMRMSILKEGKPIEFMGRKLRGDLEEVGQIEVVKVEKDLSYGKVISTTVKVKRGMKVREILERRVQAL